MTNDNGNSRANRYRLRSPINESIVLPIGINIVIFAKSNTFFAYKTYISDKWSPDEDYYEYLERIKYSRDSLYVSKVKEIHKQFFDIK